MTIFLIRVAFKLYNKKKDNKNVASIRSQLIHQPTTRGILQREHAIIVDIFIPGSPGAAEPQRDPSADDIAEAEERPQQSAGLQI